MKKLFPFIAVLFVTIAIYFLFFNYKKNSDDQPKQAAIALKKHSDKFNNSTDSVVNAYLDIKNAFVNADTAGAKDAARNFIVLIDRIPIDELKKDNATIFETVQSNIADIKSNATSLLNQTNSTERRKDFSAVSDMM